MLDLEHAKLVFMEYVKSYHPDDERIALKIGHTYEVMLHCEKIAKAENLCKEDIAIASLIGLLHDIGRFEQVRRFQTFLDADSVNHALLGIEILKEQNFLREFNSDPAADTFILTAIRNHNRFQLEEGLSARERMFCQIIRDADKIDIFRVNQTNSTNALFMCEESEMRQSYISDAVFQDMFMHTSILSEKRKTPADILLSHAALVYDMVFSYTLQTVVKKNYIALLLHRYSFEQEDTTKKIALCEAELQDYLHSRIQVRS